MEIPNGILLVSFFLFWGLALIFEMGVARCDKGIGALVAGVIVFLTWIVYICFGVISF